MTNTVETNFHLLGIDEAMGQIKAMKTAAEEALKGAPAITEFQVIDKDGKPRHGGN